MSAFSNYLEQKILELVFKNLSYGPLANVWVALYSVAPSDSGGGTELSGGGYLRVSTAPAGWTVTVGALTNASDIVFATASATWNIVAAGIFDASTGGNLLFHGGVTPTTINSGGQARFVAGQLNMTLD